MGGRTRRPKHKQNLGFGKHPRNAPGDPCQRIGGLLAVFARNGLAKTGAAY